MASPHVTGGARRHSKRTRARILEAARRELGRDPDSSLTAIAGAAGVVRRTVYDHFAGRSALVEGLAADTAQALRQALAAVAPPDDDAVSAMARFVLALWPVGDRYRTLLRLVRQDPGTERMHEVLAPARDLATEIITSGQRKGVFRTSIPPAPLSRALEDLLLALLDSVNSGAWHDDGTRSAIAALIAVGADDAIAVARVRELSRAATVAPTGPSAPEDSSARHTRAASEHSR